MPVVLLILLSAALAPIQAGARISIGPQALTLPEIAARLSVDGRTIACADSLTDTAALVCLRDRSWEDARKAIEDGLELRITRKPGSGDRWTMERDPAVEAREHAWRVKFAAALRDQLNRKIGSADLAAQPYPAVYEQLRQRYAEVEKAKAEGSANARKLAQDLNMTSGRYSAATWLAARALRSGIVGDFSQSLKRDAPYRKLNLEGVIAPEALPAVWAGMCGGLAPPDQPLQKLVAANPCPEEVSLFARASFEPFSLALDVKVALVGSDRILTGQGFFAVPGPYGTEAVFHGAHDEARRFHFAGLGGEAAKWLDGERAETAAFLDGKSGLKKFRVPDGRAIHDLSEVIEAYCGAGGEAVMRLCPIRETLGACYAKTIEVTAGTETSLHDVLRPDCIWTLREQSGILLAQNQLSFVDGLRAFPMRSFLKLERSVRREGRTAVEPGLSDLTAFADAMAAEQVRNLRSLLRPDYRGIGVGKLVPIAGPLMILEHLIDRQRAEMETALDGGQSYDIPISRMPPRTAARVVDFYRAAYLDSSMTLNPGFDVVIRSAAIHLTVTGGPKHMLTLRLAAENLPAEWADLDTFGDWPVCPWTSGRTDRN